MIYQFTTDDSIWETAYRNIAFIDNSPVNEPFTLKIFNVNGSLDVELIYNGEYIGVWRGFELAQGVEVFNIEGLKVFLSFITLREGEVDPDYFQCYSERMLDWSRSHECECLSLLESEDIEIRSM